MDQLTPADTLSILKELRRRMEDPEDWGAGPLSMACAPLCVLGHALDINQSQEASYVPFYEGNELEGVAHILAATSPHFASTTEPTCRVWNNSDLLRFENDHARLLEWLDRAVAMASDALGKATVTASGAVTAAIEVKA